MEGRDVLYDPARARGAEMRIQPARLVPGEVEDVVDHGEERVARGADRLDQAFGHSGHAVHGRADLVARIGPGHRLRSDLRTGEVVGGAPALEHRQAEMPGGDESGEIVDRHVPGAHRRHHRAVRHAARGGARQQDRERRELGDGIRGREARGRDAVQPACRAFATSNIMAAIGPPMPPNIPIPTPARRMRGSGGSLRPETGAGRRPCGAR